MGPIEYRQKVRSQIFRFSTGDSIYTPPRMGRVEYKQRMRSEIVRVSESADTVKTFKGMLINSKRGLIKTPLLLLKARS